MASLHWDRSSWLLALFLLVGVLAPSGSVLWFMNDAARSQAESASQKVAEAYRGQLGMLRERVDTWWRERASALDGLAGAGPSVFPASLGASGADALVWLDERGSPVYPSLPGEPAPDRAPDTTAWREAESSERSGRLAEAAAQWGEIADSERDADRAALAAQGQIRCLLRAGQTGGALAAIEHRFAGTAPRRARDREGRLIAADELLLALHLLPHRDPRFGAFAARLAAKLNDYQGPPMLSAQRLFLVGELRRLAPEAASFPTYPAELLAEQFLEADRAQRGDPVLESSGLRDVWMLTSPNRRLVALYRGATVASLTNRVLAG